jgi:ABC-type glycerol-3-phosphate transport system substrate-binding protein
MKFKILAVFGLAAVLFIGACGGNKDTNTNANMNASRASTPTPTPVVVTNESTAVDPAMKSKVEAALKAKGFNDVTVDTSTPKATLRGTVAKGKMAEAVRIAQETAGKPFDNQITEK